MNLKWMIDGCVTTIHNGAFCCPNTTLIHVLSVQSGGFCTTQVCPCSLCRDTAYKHRHCGLWLHTPSIIHFKFISPPYMYCIRDRVLFINVASLTRA